MTIEIRPYEDRDRDGLLELWRQSLPLDSIGLEEFERRVLLDPNREHESLILAVPPAGGEPLGFVLCLVLRYPIENTGLIENRGFITAFGVHPDCRRQGIGTRLLEAAERFFEHRNRREVTIAPYTPNYFAPGVDKERYRDGILFLRHHGFEEFIEAIAMDALIGQFEMDIDLLERERQLKAEGLVIEAFRRERMTEYLEFMDATMPGPWLADARRNLIDMTRGLFPEDGIVLALANDRIVGYCQFEGEHFGPFGVAEGWQGRGIGTVLLARTIERMRLKGHHAAYVLWTGERAAQGVYKRLGFQVTRRFAIMRKELASDG